MAIELVSRRERKKLAQRHSIREETIALIGRYGIEGTTIDAICDCADIAKKTFYNYYGSKQDLLLDICQTMLLQRADTLIDEAMSHSPELGRQLDHIFAVMNQRQQEAGKLERELFDYMVSSLSSNLEAGAGQLTFMNRCFQRLYDAAEAQLRPGLTPQFCAEMTVGMINAVTLNWLHDNHYDTAQKYRMLRDHIKYSMLR